MDSLQENEVILLDERNENLTNNQALAWFNGGGI